MDHSPKNTQATFPATCWTLLVKLRSAGDEEQRLAGWGRVCETYWFPLYAFARHRGHSKHDAEDAVQGFFATVATADYFDKADRELGKLRTFLLTGFTRYLKDLAVQRSALKRGGDQVILSLDIDQAEEWMRDEGPSGDEALVMEFERHWAQTLMRNALLAMEHDAARTEKSALRFQILKGFLSPGGLLDTSRVDAARELGMTPEACDKAIQRLRRSFRETVKDLIAGTLAHPTPESIREEMQELQRSLLAH